MANLLSRFFGYKPSRKPIQRRTARLGLETLESRVVPATGFIGPNLLNAGTGTALAPPALAAPITIDLVTKTLTLTGDQFANNARVTIDTHNNTNPLDDEVVAAIYRDNQTYTQRFARSAVSNIVFNGNAGNDVFTNNTNISSLVFGGAGNDTLYGGSVRDRIYGGAGNDYIHGGAGNDDLFGDDGSGMNPYGGDGDDHLFGEAGSDLINGESGNDYIEDLDNEVGTIYGGEGDDVITAGLNKVIYGDKDPLRCSPTESVGHGNDTITGGGWIYGGDGNDTIYAVGFGINHIFGGAGDDWIYGSAGNDTIYAGNGNDHVYGGAGNDLMYGGAGNDLMYGGDGNDSVLGEADNDVVRGDAGNDIVYGGDGDDFVYGGADDDWCYGGAGSDYVSGDAGNDTLSGGYLNFSATEKSTHGDISDGSYDYLYGNSGLDEFLVGDKKLPYWWLDTAEDATTGDNVQEIGWIGFLGHGEPYWGHLYGTPDV